MGRFLYFYVHDQQHDAIIALADPGNTKRSREIFPPSVYLINETDDQLVAQVGGDEIYTVNLTSAVTSGPHADCACPVPREWCKHATAVARAAAVHAWSASIPIPTLSRLATASNAELAKIISELQRRVPQVGPALATVEFGKPSLDEDGLRLAAGSSDNRGGDIPAPLRETAERFFGQAGVEYFNRMLFFAHHSPEGMWV